jgi:hypothetical protein
VGVKPWVEKIVIAQCGERCAYPGCLTYLISRSEAGLSLRFQGEIAHITGKNPGSARYDKALTDLARNSHENLIVLCPTHHAEVDALQARDRYSAQQLRDWKTEHVRKCSVATRKALAEVNFTELGEVCKAFIIHVQSDNIDPSLALTPPAEKIRKNNLESLSEDIKSGLFRAQIVHDFIVSRTKTEPNFERQLRSGFQLRYSKLVYDGLSPVEIYLELLDIARAHSENGSYAAALTIVCALFESCEIFER